MKMMKETQHPIPNTHIDTNTISIYKDIKSKYRHNENRRNNGT